MRMKCAVCGHISNEMPDYCPVCGSLNFVQEDENEAAESEPVQESEPTQPEQIQPEPIQQEPIQPEPVQTDNIRQTIMERSEQQSEGKSWRSWHEMPIGHKAAVTAISSLDRFVTTFVDEMGRKRNAVNEEKQRLDNNFAGKSQSINDQYQKTLEECQNMYTVRLQTNNENGRKVESILAIADYYANNIPTGFRKAKSSAGVYRNMIMGNTGPISQALAEQKTSIDQLNAVERDICREKANIQLTNARQEYDRARRNQDEEFERFSDTLQNNSAYDISKGMNRNDIATYSRYIESSKLNEEKYESPTRLPEYICLGTLCMDIDTSSGVDYTSIAHIVETEASSIIEKNDKVYTVKLPYCQRLMDGISLFVGYDEDDRALLTSKIMPLLLKMFMYFPAGRLEATMIDPLDMGGSFQGLSRLAGTMNERVIDTKIWSKESDIEQVIANLRLRMETINQAYSGDRESRFEKEPVRMLAITDFPVGFTNNALKDLQAIVRNSALLGVGILIWANNKELAKFREKNESLYQEIASNILVTNAHGDKLYMSRNRMYLTLDPMSVIQSNCDRIVDIISNNISLSGYTKTEKFADMYDFDIEDNNNWFTGLDHEIAIPLGVKGASTIVSMVLGRGGGSTEHHVLIAGQTGSGKTTLLHTLIMSTLIQYSPDDVQMYLVDFKEGVAFKPYTRYRIPSFRVVAIDSEREFGLNILNELVKELDVRADMFSREDVEDINDYNDIPGVKKVPKLLLIFDEVQELFRSKGDNDRIAKDSLSAINKLVTQGRALGIHLILACQDFSHCQGLQTYFSQMAVRIAIKGSEEGAASILSADNKGTKALQNQPAGSAIYNRAGGAESANIFFQVAYMGKEDRLAMLEKFDAYYTDSVVAQKYKDLTTRVMLTNAEDNVNNSFNSFIKYGMYDGLKSLTGTNNSYGLHLGQGFGKRMDFTIELLREAGSNLMVVGMNEVMAMSIFMFSAMSLLFDELFTDNDAGNTLIYIADMSAAEIDNDKCTFDYLQEVLPDQVTVVKLGKLGELIDSLYRNVTERREGTADSNERVFFMPFGINRAVRKIANDRMYDDEEQTVSTVQKLGTIFRYGPECGVNTILWGESTGAIRKTLGDNVDSLFDMRIAYGLSADEMNDLVMELNPTSMNEASAVYLNANTDTTNTHFRPYALPAKVWIDEYADAYLETVGGESEEMDYE